MNTPLAFAKGHATENDFIIIQDEEGVINLSPADVAALCERRAGIGADGLLRVVKASAVAESKDLEIPGDLWFMDYRNADGSIAEMCGNGVRLFAHWLYVHELVASNSFQIGTRAGIRAVTVESADQNNAVVKVDMGPAEVRGLSTSEMAGHNYAGLGIDVGNPHLACVVPGMTAQELEELQFCVPTIDAEFFPQGVNLEVLTELKDGAVSMRVWERGVGETRSCGTGTVAATRAALADAGLHAGVVKVKIRGGEVVVEITETSSFLTGPSSIVATGEVVLP